MYTPIKRASQHAINEMAVDFQTPQAQISFSRELRQVLQERNLLTAKSRRKVCSMLDGDASPMSTPIPEVDKRRGFRLQAIQEIVSSEKAYLQQLEMLMQYFVRPLKERAIIDVASHTALFGQIEMIYNLNGELLQELERDMEQLASAFLKMAPFFKLYSVYAFDYRSALLIVQELTSKNPAFRKFLQLTESRPEVQRKLNSLMIVPIQRVPRYKLLLEQVLLYTSPADADFKLMKESVKQIESTVSHINSCIEDQEVTLLLINLQNSLAARTPNIVKPSRKVIKEGVLQKITRNGSEIKRYCVLMSDIFMYCKILKERTPNTVVENSLECCCIFPLKKCKVYELFPGNFKLTCQNDGIIFGTSDLQLGRAWVGFIRDAIDLHIQCRKTLRKESSKRTPMRKKDLKNFETDYVLSPSKRKCDYDTIFRNKNRSTDSEEEHGDDVTSGSSCFPRRKTPTITIALPTTNIGNLPKKQKSLKRPAPPAPATATSTIHRTNAENANTKQTNRISKLYNFISSDNLRTRGILKRSTTTTACTTTPLQSNTDHDPTYGFATRYSDTKSYFRTHNVDNTIPRAVKREDVFGDAGGGGDCLGDGNFRDQLFPLRSSGGSNKSGCSSNTGGANGWSLPASAAHLSEKENVSTPPQKKRVKFDDSQDSPDLGRVRVKNNKEQVFVFPSDAVGSTSKISLRKKIYEFFANLF